MATNNNKFLCFGVILNAPKEKATTDQVNDFFNTALTALKDYNKIKFFASAIHDHDKHEDGTAKTIHCHIMIELYEKSTILGALRDFSNALGVDKGLLSLEGSNNLAGLVQYLTHKTKPNKYQYPYGVITTSNAERCEELYTAEILDKEEAILKALEECETVTDLVRKLGPTKARPYLAMFKYIKQEQAEHIADKLRHFDFYAGRYDSLRQFTEILLNTLENGLKDHDKRIINLDRFLERFRRDY